MHVAYITIIDLKRNQQSQWITDWNKEEQKEAIMNLIRGNKQL